MFEIFRKKHENHVVLSNYIEYVEDEVEIIGNYAKEDNDKDAFGWYGILLKEMYLQKSAVGGPHTIIITRSFPDGDRRVDLTNTRQLAKEKLAILEHAVNLANRIFKRKGWKFRFQESA